MRLPITPATTLWRSLRDEVRRDYRAGRVIVAVDGIDGAGKTTFAEGLASVFAEDGSAVFRASIDGFHRPRVERYARGRTSPEGFYRDSYDYATFRRVLIDPFRDGGQPALRPDSSSRRSTCIAMRRSIRVGDGAARRGARRRRDLPAPPRAAGHLALVGLARRAARCRRPPRRRSRRHRSRLPAPSNTRYREGQELYLVKRGRGPRHPPSSTTPTPITRTASSRTSADGRAGHPPRRQAAGDHQPRRRRPRAQALGTRKIGHAGTLDPMATGLLVLGVEGATRLLTFIVGLDKTYEATIRLGVSTDSDDADGEIIEPTDASAIDLPRRSSRASRR